MVEISDDEVDREDEVMAFYADISAYTTKLLLDNTSNLSWIFDSSASKHIIGYMEDFSLLQPQSRVITIAGGTYLAVEAVDTVDILLQLPNRSITKS